jgi:hypothetical protein
MYYPDAKVNHPDDESYQHNALPVSDDQTANITELISSFRRDSFTTFNFSEERASLVSGNGAVCNFKLKATLKSPFNPGGGQGDDQIKVLRAFEACGFTKDAVPTFTEMTILFSISGTTDNNSCFINACWDKTTDGKFIDIKFAP